MRAELCCLLTETVSTARQILAATETATEAATANCANIVRRLTVHTLCLDAAVRDSFTLLMVLQESNCSTKFLKEFYNIKINFPRTFLVWAIFFNFLLIFNLLKCIYLSSVLKMKSILGMFIEKNSAPFWKYSSSFFLGYCNTLWTAFVLA